MFTILLVVCGTISILAGGVLLLNIAHAPEGYEDATGFHLGKEPGAVPIRKAGSRIRKVRNSPPLIGQHLPAA